MKVEVLGPGCKRCDQLYDNTKAAAEAFDQSAGIEIIKVSDVNYFAKMGVFMTPGLVIDGEVIATGKVLTADEIKSEIQAKL
ncbi:MAG: thioredoxin family protein [Desulfobacterales bacterium]|nr:thioredoxin family protein [Desulfobacterales bacterium]